MIKHIALIIALSLGINVGSTPHHLITPSAHAQSLDQSSRPQLNESFSVGELTLTTGAIIGIGLLNLWGERWIGPHAPSMGAPLEGSTDLRFSRWANPKPEAGTQWLGGAPDLAGYIAPVLASTYYIGGAVLGGPDGWMGAQPHEALAFVEGLSWAMFSTTLLKHLVGRERPYVVRGRLGELKTSEVKMRSSERLLSFPSGHSTAIAATSFFIAADVSDALVTGPLSEEGPWVQGFVGRALPYLTASAISSVVMYSRVRDQRHWLSDILTGAVIGAGSALLSYHLHFNARGEPTRR